MGEMRIIKKVFTSEPYTDWHWDTLVEAFGSDIEIKRAPHNDIPAVKEGIRDADVAIMAGDISLEVLNAAKELKWVHCDHAGANNSAHPELFQRDIFLTASAGRSAPVLAEHVFYLLLSLVYNSRMVEQQQREHNWSKLYQNSRGLYTGTMGIIGLGHTGRALALRAKAFEMNVIGYDREAFDLPPGVDKAYFADKGQSVDELLKECDAAVLTVRLSDETFHM
ncbi:MAG: hypothetical protein LBQ67_07725, partial [Treponema sp.]|nr:hypothetical protein [Treponema sp.]